MPPPWSTPLEIGRLADGEAEIEFAVPLAELPRLRAQVPDVEGVVSGRAHFMRERGLAVAQLTLSGSATVVCQRCLAPMQEPISSSARVALIASEADAGTVPEDLEPVLATNGRISIGELVEEELLLALPIVPLHARATECAVASDQRESVQQEQMQRPFEGLGKLLKR